MFVEVRVVAEEDSDLLLAAVEEAEAPVRGLVIEVEAAVELGAAAPFRAAMAALLATLTPLCPSSAISAELTHRQWTSSRSGPRKSLANRIASRARMAAGVMVTTAPAAPTSVLERTTVMRPLPSSQRCKSPQVSAAASERRNPRQRGRPPGPGRSGRAGRPALAFRSRGPGVSER